jgi:hypothetical protein
VIALAAAENSSTEATFIFADPRTLRQNCQVPRSVYWISESSLLITRHRLRFVRGYSHMQSNGGPDAEPHIADG